MGVSIYSNIHNCFSLNKLEIKFHPFVSSLKKVWITLYVRVYVWVDEGNNSWESSAKLNPYSPSAPTLSWPMNPRLISLNINLILNDVIFVLPIHYIWHTTNATSCFSTKKLVTRVHLLKKWIFCCFMKCDSLQSARCHHL